MIEQFSINEMTNDYLNRIPKEDIEMKYNLKFETFRVKMNRLGIKRGLPKEFKKQKLKVKHADIIKMYVDGNSMDKIAELVGCSARNIINILAKNNIQSRSHSKAGQKYEINEDFFESIDTEEKAYFLGMLYADGCVSSTRTSVSLALKESDKEIVERLNRLIYPIKDVYYMKRHGREHEDLQKSFGKFKFKDKYEGRYAVIITNKKIKEDLIKLGCVPAKSLILTFPNYNQVPEHLIHHFIRGYFDGDGCISLDKNKGRYSFSLVGTLQFLTDVQEELVNNNDINYTKFYCHKNSITTTRTLTYAGINNVLKIRSYLYKDATIFMQRKYKKFFSI